MVVTKIATTEIKKKTKKGPIIAPAIAMRLLKRILNDTGFSKQKKTADIQLGVQDAHKFVCQTNCNENWIQVFQLYKHG